MQGGENIGFNAEKQRAIEHMREIKARSKFTQNTCNTGQNNKCAKEKETGTPPPSFLEGIRLPFPGDTGKDPDIALIMGLALILMAENSDKLLLLALLYILI